MVSDSDSPGLRDTESGLRRALVRRRRSLLILVGTGLAFLEVLKSPNVAPAVLATDVFAGASLIAAAVALLGLDPGRRIGLICAVTGIAWFGAAFSPLLEGVYLGPLGHLIVGYPTGRVRRGLATIVVAGAYLAGFVAPAVAVDVRSLVLVLVVVVSIDGALRTQGPLRRGRLSGAVTGAMIALVAVGTSVGESQGWIELDIARIVYATVIGLGAVWLAVDLRWGGWSQDALARLVIDLGDRDEPATLRSRLAEVLGDPTLVIGYRVATGPSYVDDAGLPVEVAAAGSDRITVPLVAGGAEVGVLIRDGRMETDRLLAEGVARAAELALANARLNAGAQHRLRELDASRSRLIAAEETERTRIRSELDAGALRRLAIVEARLAHEPQDETSVSLLREVRAVITQLEEFGRGLGASTPLQAGLNEALRMLAQRSSVPATVTMRSGLRWSPVIESTMYFVASEALTNIDRHSGATRAWLRVDDLGRSVRLEVEDDGVGGAAPSSGSGLEGLIQRVEATGGRLRLESQAGQGTRLTLELPVHVSAEAGTTGSVIVSPTVADR